MPRPPRIIDPNGVYHVYNRGNNKAPLFRDERDYAFFTRVTLEAKEKYGFSLYNYMWMPNHIHMTIRPNGLHLPEIMHKIKGGFVRFFCRKYDHVGHIWENRYRHKTIGNDEYLFACGNYIEMNPVRAGLAAAPEEWPHSSYRYYAFGENDPLVDENPYYANIGRIAEERRFQYRRLISTTRSA